MTELHVREDQYPVCECGSFFCGRLVRSETPPYLPMKAWEVVGNVPSDVCAILPEHFDAGEHELIARRRGWLVVRLKSYD